MSPSTDPDPRPDAPERAKNRETDNENMKAPRDDGPPRSATEPRGSEGSARNPKTQTDPASGETLTPSPAESAHR